MNQVLFPNLTPTFIAKGHEIVDNIELADVVLFDLHVRTHDYDQKDIQLILDNDVFVASFCEYDRGGMSSAQWPFPLWSNQKSVMDKVMNSGVHFCRLLSKTKTHLPNLYPYEKPIFYQEEMCSPEELLNRPYDVCMICNTSPSRESIARAIESDSRLSSIVRIAAPKIPFDNWVDAHRKAKLFVSASGGGFSNERPQNLFSVSAMIQEKTDQLLLHPFTHMENCIKISSTPTKTELGIIYEVTHSKDLLYEIYSNNYQFMKKYYSAEYIATDILNKILAHA